MQPRQPYPPNNNRPDNRGQRQPQGAEAAISVEFIRGEMAKIVEKAQDIGIRLKDAGVDMNQLRNFYEGVVQLGIELQDERRTAGNSSGSSNPTLLRQASVLPTKLIWAAAKQDNERKRNALKEFNRYVEPSVKGLFEQGLLHYEYYACFQDFVEAVVIYHKARANEII